MAEDGRDPLDGLYITTQKETDARVARLLPTTPSEDASSLLVVPPEIIEAMLDDEDEYRPEPAIEWIVRVDLTQQSQLHRDEIHELFDSDWLEAHGHPTFYGFDSENGQWSYVYAADAPMRFSRLQLAWRLLPFDVEEAISVDKVRGWLAAVHARVSGRGEVGVSVDPEGAHRRARELRGIAERCDQHVEIFLGAPDGERFDGRGVWDVMLSLGLRWGDMDLFHWTNPEEVGDEALFSVGTTTEPGYFLPEAIAAGRCRVQDLAFAFSIPRSAAPGAVFESMLRAAQYAQTRLGGGLYSADGPFDVAGTRTWIAEVVTMLERAGFPPGAPLTLMLF